MSKLPVLIINNGILFPNTEYRSETTNYKEQELLDMLEKSQSKELIIIHSLDDVSKDDVTEFPNVGLLATLTLKLNIPNSKVRYSIAGIKRVIIENYEENKDMLAR